MDEYLNEKQLNFLNEKARLEMGGGEKAIEKLHARGKLTARERIDLLFDPGTFVEYGLFVKHRCSNFGMENVDIPSEAVVTGFGKVNGRLVYAYAHDATVLGGALGEMQGRKIARLMDAAIAAKAPLISLNDCGGARIQEGGDTATFIDIFWHNVQASGYIPQISAIMGPCAGGAAYSPALTDFIINVDQTSQMFITGPKVIKQVTGEDIDVETLGGAKTHNTITGVSHLLAADDEDCVDKIKLLLSYLPQNCYDKPPVYACTDPIDEDIDELNTIIPENPKKAYDVHRIIELISDTGSFFEIQPLYAPNIVVGFARLDGKSVGFVANQVKYMAGSLDTDASEKAAHFINICNAFNIPLIFLTDVPGYLPGVAQEHSGIIRRGAKMVYAVDHATVPKINVIMRKCFGGAAAAMCTQYCRSDVTIAWPGISTAVMGAAGAVSIIYGKQLKAIEDSAEREAKTKEFMEIYEKTLGSEFEGVKRELAGMMVLPSWTRRILIQCLESLENKEVAEIKKKPGGLMPV